MFYVYCIKSESHPDQTYIGLTNNVDNRLATHNAGQSPHTSKWAPWKLVFFVAVMTESKAIELEKYCKIGSGKTFAQKHLIA